MFSKFKILATGLIGVSVMAVTLLGAGTAKAMHTFNSFPVKIHTISSFDRFDRFDRFHFFPKFHVNPFFHRFDRFNGFNRFDRFHRFDRFDRFNRFDRRF